MHKASKWIKAYGKPVVFDECCYEGDIEFPWGNISGFEMVKRFWKGYIQGAYVTHGETFFSEDEILWWSKGGVKWLSQLLDSPHFLFISAILFLRSLL